MYVDVHLVFVLGHAVCVFDEGAVLVFEVVEVLDDLALVSCFDVAGQDHGQFVVLDVLEGVAEHFQEGVVAVEHEGVDVANDDWDCHEFEFFFEHVEQFVSRLVELLHHDLFLNLLFH